MGWHEALGHDAMTVLTFQIQVDIVGIFARDCETTSEGRLRCNRERRVFTSRHSSNRVTLSTRRSLLHLPVFM